VATSGSMIVHPAATTVYTLTAYNKTDKSPPSLTAKITARVARPPSVSNFVASPPAITQGASTRLSWSGDAVNYSVSDGTTTFNVGPRRSLVVRPAATTAYTLQAVGPGGTVTTPPLTVTVDPHPATALTYSNPASGALQLVADCSPCAPVTLRIKATATVQLRGVALNLPLDSTKVTFDGFAAGPALTGGVSKATMGRGPLQDVLVIGIALEGTGTAAAQDVTLNSGDELAHFTLGLVSAGVEEGIGTVDTRHEQAAAHAADATARLTRGIGVCAVTAGPGVTDALTGIANAYAANSPVLLLGGAAPSFNAGKGSLQEMEQVDLFTRITKWSDRVPAPDRVPTYMAKAFRTMLTGRPGPVFLELPWDVLSNGVEDSECPLATGYRTRARQPGDPAYVDRAVQLLEKASRPVIVAGSSIWWDDAPTQLAAFAERLGAPVYLNGAGRGCLPPDHPHFFSQTRKDALAEADVVLIAGTPLDF